MKKRAQLDIDIVNKNIRDDILKFKPKHELGQNFIFDEMILSQIADVCYSIDGQSILEIGSGPGTLTHELVQKGSNVLAVEIDDSLISIAKKNLQHDQKVTFLCKDIMQTDIAELFDDKLISAPYIAAGNIPYYITQPILQKLLFADPRPTKIVLMTQKELAERIVGGDKKESFLSLLVQIYGNAEKNFDVPASAFWPMPKVNSSLISITPYPDSTFDDEFIIDLLSVIKIGFSAPRKQIHNVFKMSLDINPSKLDKMLFASNISPKARAQHISLDSWVSLTKYFKNEFSVMLGELRNVY
ncbi:MAG: ribosomal RNA small subunit methyltransferase A [Chloroflexi bacterium]|nr:ribosomal RNA small subunit methyltransferase A [Chloroflexota bacterium]|tara:strand:- start:32303 stop:33202 length:900 start_codon:yes stop_codon:yes gene_type:complete